MYIFKVTGFNPGRVDVDHKPNRHQEYYSNCTITEFSVTIVNINRLQTSSNNFNFIHPADNTQQTESCYVARRHGGSSEPLNSWAIAVPITISWYMLAPAKIISVLQSINKTLSREQCLFQLQESSLVVKWMIYAWGLDTILQSGPVLLLLWMTHVSS